MAQQQREVLAAGAVVTRRGKQVLLVHRPGYNDWSFPKGKLDRGEHLTTCAVRETGEETGLHVRLGLPLPDQTYQVGRRDKRVHYWTARVVGDDDVSGYQINKEIDDVAWVPYADAAKLLTYPRDRETLAQALGVKKRSRALIVLRHGKARSRRGWSKKKDDRRRPLVQLGGLQAQRLVPILAAYDASLVRTSSSTRCVDTVSPYAEVSGWSLQLDDGLSEEGLSAKKVTRAVDELLESDEGAVLCTHRPVLPSVFDALGVPEVKLEPGSLLVVHHRRGRVLATEHHSP